MTRQFQGGEAGHLHCNYGRVGGEPEGTQIPGGEVAAATQNGGGKRRGEYTLVHLIKPTHRWGTATTCSYTDANAHITINQVILSFL